MDFGVIGGYCLTKQYQKNRTMEKSEGVSFSEIAAAKMTQKAEGANFEELLKSKYPKAYYNVMDTSKIDDGLWGRNDYPWDAYFLEPADKSVLEWTPSGAEPSMQDSKVQSKINSMAGQMSIVIPPELEEKMQSNPELAQQVLERVDYFIATHYRMEANQGFLITFDKNGEINHACVVSEGKVIVSSSEFVEEQKARKAKQAEYERLAEKSALKRRQVEQLSNVANTQKVYQIYMEDDMIYSGGNGTGLSFYIKYAKESTKDDPIVLAKGVDENGDEFEQTIHINQINPKCATIVEMRALEAHIGVSKRGGFTSLPLETGHMGLHDRADFMSMLQKQISDMLLLGQKQTALYYQYSMQEYWKFIKINNKYS